MGDFRQNRRSGGSDRYPRRDFDRPQAMFRATCASCGNSCEVPFKPSGDRPVYCSNCFEGRRDRDNDSSGSERRNFARPSFRDRNGSNTTNDSGKVFGLINELNNKLDKVIRILELEHPKKQNTTSPRESVTQEIAVETGVSKKTPSKKKSDKETLIVETS